VTDATPYRAATPRLRKRAYKTREAQKRAEKRYGTRVESWGGGTSGYHLWVYDLDEFGQPPSFVCPCCGADIDE
jgi:hypothetical protein